MPETNVGVKLSAKDDATQHIKRVADQLAVLTRAGSQVSPAMGAASKGLSAFAAAGAGLGPVGIAASVSAAGIASVGAAVTMLVGEVDKLASSAEQISNFSQKTGIGVELLQGWRQAAKDAGVADGALEAGMRFLSKAVADHDPLLRKLGITTNNVGDASLQLADRFARTEDGAYKARYALGLLGKGGTDLIPVFNLGANAIRETTAASLAMGTSLSTDAVGALLRTDAQFDEVKNRLSGLTKEMLVLSAPTITDLLKQLNELLGGLNKIRDGFKGAGDGVHSFAERIPGAKTIERLAALAAAAERVQKVLSGPHVDRGVILTGGEKGKLDPPEGDGDSRRKRLETIIDLMKVGAKEADAFLLKLEAIERATQKRKLIEDLAKAGANVAGFVGPLALGGGSDTSGAPGSFNDTRPHPGQLVPGPLAIDHGTRHGQAGQLGNELRNWKDDLNQLMGAVQLVRGGLAAVFEGLRDGMQRVFGGLLEKGQTFRSAMGTVFKSLAQTILAYLSQIVSSAIFALFLKLASWALGIPLVGSSGGGSFSGFGSIAKLGVAQRAPSGSASASAGFGHTTIINNYVSALDSQSIYEAMTYSNGSMRAAQQQAWRVATAFE